MEVPAAEALSNFFCRVDSMAWEWQLKQNIDIATSNQPVYNQSNLKNILSSKVLEILVKRIFDLNCEKDLTSNDLGGFLCLQLPVSPGGLSAAEVELLARVRNRSWRLHLLEFFLQLPHRFDSPKSRTQT